MRNETREKVFASWVHGLKAPEIDKYERAEAIKDYIEKKNISGREFARQFDIPKSTVEDWLLPARLKIEDYNSLIKDGYTDKEIYLLLRNTKKTDPIKLSSTEKQICLLTDKLNRSSSAKYCSQEIDELIDKLLKSINTFKFRIEKFREAQRKCPN